MKKRIRTLIILFLISIIIGTYIYVDSSLTPTITILAESKAKEVANRGINEAVSSIVRDKYNYTDLINTKVDSEGKISMIQANTTLINKIASEISLEVQDEFKKIKKTVTYIPLGSALQSPLLAKYGPQVKVEIEPLGVVNIDFKTDFKSEGINQTKHTIYLEVKTEVDVVVPLTTETKEIITQVPITETIIVGEVPESFISVPPEIAPNFFE